MQAPLSRRTVALFVVAIGALGAGCGVSVEGGDTKSQIINEVLDSKIEAIVGGALIWGVLGALAGGLIGLVLFFTIRRLRGFELGWPHAKWLRVLVALAYAAGGVTFIGAVGSLQGSLDGARVAVTEGPMGKKILPRVGEACATFVAIMDVALRQDRDQLIAHGPDMAEVRAFESGEQRLDVARFVRNVRRVDKDTANAVVAASRMHLLTRSPELEGTLTDRIMTFVLATLAERLVEKGAERLRTERPLMRVITRMSTAADRAATKGALTHDELTAHIVEQALIPWTIGPIEGVVRGQQKAMLLALLVLLLVPVVAFRTAHHFYEQSRRAQ